MYSIVIGCQTYKQISYICNVGSTFNISQTLKGLANAGGSVLSFWLSVVFDLNMNRIYLREN